MELETIETIVYIILGIIPVIIAFGAYNSEEAIARRDYSKGKFLLFCDWVILLLISALFSCLAAGVAYFIFNHIKIV